MKDTFTRLRQSIFVSRFFRWLFQNELRAMENHVIHNFKEDAIRQLNENARAREMVDSAIKDSPVKGADGTNIIRVKRFSKKYGGSKGGAA